MTAIAVTRERARAVHHFGVRSVHFLSARSSTGSGRWKNPPLADATFMGPSEGGERGDRDIGDEHVPGRVRDHQRRPDCHRHCLGRHAAGPEHRTSPGRTGTGSPQSGPARSAMPIASGAPTWTGAPCTAGNRADICTAFATSVPGIGRIDTTIGPWNTPAGRHCTDVRYMGTVHPHSRCRSVHPGLKHDVLEREAASQEKPNEIVGPIRLDRPRLIDELPMPIDAVPRQVGAQIGIGRGELGTGEPGQLRPRTGQGFGLRMQNSKKS